MELLNVRSGKHQRGLSLLYAMLALAALAIASIGLMRSVSMSSTVAGNLSFQQEATAAADQATRQVIATLYSKVSGNSSGLDSDLADIGYYASTDELVDVTGSQLTTNTRKLVKWTSTYCSEQSSGTYAECTKQPVTLAGKINGNTASYIAFRLCNTDGPSDSGTINCARPLKASTTSGTNEVRDYSSGTGVSKSTILPYVRIVVRVSGARNTTSYTETIVHF
ncbi:MAG: hypothetical protein WBK19_11795 [Azonexus sp.]